MLLLLAQRAGGGLAGGAATIESLDRRRGPTTNEPADLTGTNGDRLGRVSTIDALVNLLTTDILDGSFEPGQHLGEVELSERFGVSRQSLRAAMAELTHKGLLRREAHRGYRVPILTRADVEDLYRMRRILESEAIRELCAGGRDLGGLEAAVRRIEALPEDAPWSDVVDADVAIHRALVAAVGSPRMLEAYELLGAQFRLSTVPAKRYIPVAQMATAHRELLRTIHEDGADAAVARVHEHLEWGSDQLFSYLDDGAEPAGGAATRAAAAP